MVALLLAATIPFYKGVSLTPWSYQALKSKECKATIAQMARDGVDTMAVNVWEFQKDVRSTTIAPDPKSYSSSPESIRKAIRWAHAHKMRVTLKPIVDCSDGTWRAEIPDSQAWFASYRKFIAKYADMAREEKVEGFSVGCEYNGTQGNETEWRKVVALVRSRYSGPLTYAANFDSYEQVAWWDSLDFIGIDAYFTLTKKKDPTLPDLKAAWTKLADRIGVLAKQTGKPVVFTEAGYRSADGANGDAWDWARKGVVDLQEQVDCLKAMTVVMDQRPWWKGMWLWNWEVNPKAGGPKDTGYTPQNKPAEKWLRGWSRSRR